MTRSLRTYRLVAAVLGLSLLLSIGLPVVQQVCAMAFDANYEVMAEHHTCPVEAEHPSAIPLQLCDDGTSSTYSSCCMIEVQRAGESEARVENRAADSLYDVGLIPTAEFTLPVPGADTPHLPDDTRILPSSPVAVHVLHETFLN